MRAEPDAEVVAEATNGDEAIRTAAALRPDVILMDLNMLGINGIEATRQILAENPQAGILVITMFDDDSVLPPCVRAHEVPAQGRGGRGDCAGHQERLVVARRSSARRSPAG